MWCCSTKKSEKKTATAEEAVSLKMNSKFNKLTGLAQKIKPTSQEQLLIDELISKPDFYNLSTKEEHLIWKFRYTFKDHPSLLVKLLLSTQWKNQADAEEALFMM